MSKLSTLISSKDIPTTIVGISNRVGSKFVSRENGKRKTEGANWLNRITSRKLTANEKPGGGKRKHIDMDESENRNILSITKKRRAGN